MRTNAIGRFCRARLRLERVGPGSRLASHCVRLSFRNFTFERTEKKKTRKKTLIAVRRVRRAYGRHHRRDSYYKPIVFTPTRCVTATRPTFERRIILYKIGTGYYYCFFFLVDVPVAKCNYAHNYSRESDMNRYPRVKENGFHEISYEKNTEIRRQGRYP